MRLLTAHYAYVFECSFVCVSVRVNVLISDRASVAALWTVGVDVDSMRTIVMKMKLFYTTTQTIYIS